MLAPTSIIIAVLCALVIVIDIAFAGRQRMWIMNVMWPITALYAGPLALLAYFTLGRSAANDKPKQEQKQKPFWQAVIVGTLHCGAGCSLGDLIAEWTLFFFH